jgi:ABC-2 type transport system ATP-binding protein
MLDLVSLDGREAKRRIRNYSLGMRQRLGIAHALLGEPTVLILDEPANGLDPAGIRWMRGLLKGYADRGGTVLLSSHLLHEVEQIADEMILIGNGRIVARGTREELLRGATGGVATTLVTALDNQQLTDVLGQKGFQVHPAGAGLRVTAEPVDVGRVAADQQIVLTDLRAGNEGGLEDLFLELTADTAREHDVVPSAAAPPAPTTAPTTGATA